MVGQWNMGVEHWWSNSDGKSESTRRKPCTIARFPPLIQHGLVYNAQCLCMDICVNDLVWFVPRKLLSFWAHSQNFEKRLLSVVFVCPSVRMEHLASHWMDFSEIWYLLIFGKSFKKIQLSLKSDKKECFTWRPIYIFNHISLSS